jgi:hypothetical protein
MFCVRRTQSTQEEALKVNSRLYVVSAALAVACTAASGSAAVVSKAPAQAVQAPKNIPAAPYRGPRIVHTSDARVQVIIRGPAGCSSSQYGSFVGGGYSNYAGYYSGVLAGGSNDSCDYYTGITAGLFNIIGGDESSFYSTIGAGYGNGIEGQNSLIGAGFNNTIGSSAPWYGSTNSAIVSGYSNTLSAPQSFIGAGISNTVVSPATEVSNGPSSFIGAGYSNTVASDFSVITGGSTNSTTGEYSTIAGGYANVVSGTQATISGGYGNNASGKNGAIPGGSSNVASGLNSFAAGYQANAVTNGSFVWADGVGAKLTSTVSNEFLARASGGFYLYSGSTSGVRLAPGSGSWSSLSDRAAKTDVQSVDDGHILAKVAALPVSEWSYIEQGTDVRHLGPMAQDFHAAFGLGEDDKHISTVDEEGVALSAIKALQAEVAARDHELSSLEARVEALEKARNI